MEERDAQPQNNLKDYEEDAPASRENTNVPLHRNPDVDSGKQPRKDVQDYRAAEANDADEETCNLGKTEEIENVADNFDKGY